MSVWIGIVFSCVIVFGGFFLTLAMCSRFSMRNAELARKGELRPYSPLAERELADYLESLDPETRKFETGEGWAHE